ncbi:hypothetical protein [Rubellicoccus peritrichatus]|uniref:Uncharacterized protein n=1 Tax=Rubellicoccus peritrichatus TaxID=3080537 RepID=A0AAQ3LBV9_9BACT|nr:hypothetical protein [Puniceicoccus sp. CR14]WOO41694.1 hypothetical protein RZN69_01240 [Puniceicoccus sp. CR14]
MTLTEQQAASGDYVELPHKDAYATYFNQLVRVFTVLEAWVEEELGTLSPEVTALHMNLQRIHQSTELLRLKYLYEPTHSLRLDLNESGFPHFNELQRMVGDFINAEEYLRELPPELLAIEQTLDELFDTNEQPQRGLQLLGRRHYLERLLKADFMGPFRFGGVRTLETGKKHRSCVAAWSCYSSRDNLPYLHLMHFDQDIWKPELEQDSVDYNRLKTFVEQQSGHIPPLAVLATAIDEEFEWIHPKIIRRVSLGPIILPVFSFDDGPLATLLRTAGKPSDFIVQLESEVIVSSKQVVQEKGGLFREERVREIFSIDENSLECFDRKLSDIHRFLFMPHRIWQAVEEKPHFLPSKFKRSQRLAFDELNQVHIL